jgi:N-methylhydantoinase A/oxoprolinase/acetone carboxylase beta subunit
VRVKETGDGTRTVTIGPERAGPAYCMGGKEPTPTECSESARLVDVGDPERAKEAIKAVASSLGKSETEVASYSGQYCRNDCTGSERDVF